MSAINVARDSARLLSTDANSYRATEVVEPRNLHCHEGKEAKRKSFIEENRTAQKKLIIASLLCLLFMVGEIIGGALANSLAIMTDAAHLLADLASFIISMLALRFATKPATKWMTYGWHRAEVVGAVLSVQFMWLVTGILVYLAILRIVTNDYDVNGLIMLITSVCGIGVNIIMGAALHQHDHSHSGRNQSHGHSHGKRSRSCNNSHDDHTHGDHHDHGNGRHDSNESHQRHSLSDTTGSAASGSDRDNGQLEGVCEKRDEKQEALASASSIVKDKKKEINHMNINVRAAFIHVVGDLLQSIGVFIAALIIYVKPEYKIADPICTFIFSILVLFTTLNVMRDTMRVLMEAKPSDLDTVEIYNALLATPGVRAVHDLRLWSLTVEKNAMTAHLAVSKETDQQAVLRFATKQMNKFNIIEVTLQVEEYSNEMNSCSHCCLPDI